MFFTSISDFAHTENILFNFQNINHASFKKFDAAIYLRCCHGGSTVLQDTLFEQNKIAVTGYRGTMTDLKHCTFRKNDRGVDSADKYIENSVFEENVECAVCGVERTRLQGCTINGHRGKCHKNLSCYILKPIFLTTTIQRTPKICNVIFERSRCPVLSIGISVK